MKKPRKPVSQKTRFEVFKRDKFTCQYCGGKVPDVVLQVDHIQPVALDGPSDLLNLIASCRSCNGGKGARRISDQSVADKQHAQLAELEERRQQIAMVMQWRDELRALDENVIEMIGARIAERTGQAPNENGRAHIRRWLKKYSAGELMRAFDGAIDSYVEFEKDDVATSTSWEFAFTKVPAIASVNRQEKDFPEIKRLFYIQGILRNRTKDRYLNCISSLKEAMALGLTVDELEAVAKRVDDWDDFVLETEALRLPEAV